LQNSVPPPASSASHPPRLAQFLSDELERILSEWDVFARSIPSAGQLSVQDLRDHAKELLLVIAKDMTTAQTERERETKGKGNAPSTQEDTPASEHGALRQLLGFDLNQMFSEYRALRATVLRLWKAESTEQSAMAMEDIARFNEGIDQAIAESVAAYAAKMDESREMFLAVLGHDLRSPLAAISNCLNILNISQGAEAQDRIFRIGLRSVTRMNSLISDLLEYTRAELGRGIEVVAEPGNLGQLCQETFAEVQTSYPGLNFDYHSEGELSADFDGIRMQQALTNLLNNAVEHGDRQSPIAMDVLDEGAWISVTVTNQGDLIHEKELQNIFEPLVQLGTPAASGRSKPSTSMGLGLYIAKHVVTAHGGSIEVTSSLAHGTAFKVRIPRATPESRL